MKNKEKWIIMIPGGNPMKEKKTESEKTIVIDIKLTRGLVVALSCVLAIVTLLAYLMLTGKSAAASETEASQAASTGMRQYYLTPLTFTGNAVLTACADGYHFASLWEIADPSNLKYNTSLGFTVDDSGQGPPSAGIDGGYGWVRTGYVSDASSTPGQANCSNWTSDLESQGGTVVGLPCDWTAGWDEVGVWPTISFGCNLGPQVWCIED